MTDKSFDLMIYGLFYYFPAKERLLNQIIIMSSPGIEKTVKKASEPLNFKTLLSKKSAKVCFVIFHAFLTDIFLGRLKNYAKQSSML